MASTDALGHVTSTFSDGNNRPIETVNPDGTFKTNTYDSVGDLIASTDQRGKKTQYIYDAQNRLIQTLYPDGTSTSTTYNAGGRVISATPATRFPSPIPPATPRSTPTTASAGSARK